MKPFPLYLEIEAHAFKKLSDHPLDGDFYLCPVLNLTVRVEKIDKEYIVVNRVEPMMQGCKARIISERKFKKLNKDFL